MAGVLEKILIGFTFIILVNSQENVRVPSTELVFNTRKYKISFVSRHWCGLDHANLKDIHCQKSMQSWDCMNFWLATNCVRQGCEFVASCWSCMCTKHLICSKLLSKTIVEPGDRLAQGDSLTHVQYKIIPRLIYHYKFKWDFNKFGREKCFLRQS